MSWWIVLIIALPLLFVVGMVYNALKAQRKLERELLPEIIREREEERERIRKAGLAAGHAADLEQKSTDPWDDDDDWPVKKPAAKPDRKTGAD